MDDRKRLTKLRATIAKLRAERQDIEAARVNLETAIGKMRKRLYALVGEYRPRLGNFMSHHGGQPHPMFNSYDLEAFLGWALREQLGDRLEAELREKYESIPLALSPAEREERLADVDAKLLKAEREEEALIVTLHAQGIDLARRPEASIEAVLDVRA